MKISVKANGFSLTPSTEEYLRLKLDHLDRFLPFDESIIADVELAKTTAHHQKGDIFKAEINLRLPHRLLRASAQEWDLRVAIDRARDTIQEEIKKNRTKDLSLFKRGARKLKNLLRLARAAQFRRKSRGREEEI